MVKKSEIQKKNLISTIEDCLKEHTVMVADDKHTEQMFLIQMSAPSTLLKDFMETYNTSRSVEVINNSYAKLLSTIIVGAAKGTIDVAQTYGVLVDTNLTCRYAFNMEFADFNKQEEKVVFKPMEDVLMKCADEVVKKINQPKVVRERSLDDMVIRYSLMGGNGGPMLKYGMPEPRKSDVDIPRNFFLQTVKQLGKVEFKTNSLLSVIQNNFEKNNSIELIINEQPQKFYCVDTKYQTIPYIDLEKMYGKTNVSKNAEALSKKFGEKKEGTYGVLITPDMQMKLAFNRKFSRLDVAAKQVVYPKLSEIVDGTYYLGVLAEFNASIAKRERDDMPRDDNPIRFGNMMIRYSLCEPKK